MTCPRCHGPMHEERAAERRQRGSLRPIWLWACLCGERLDETIQFHRALRREETLAERNERIWRTVQRELGRVPMEVVG